MRARQALTSPLYPKIRFAFTDHPITVWAGAILLRLYFELIGLRATLTPVLTPFTKTSNNQIPPMDVLLAWWYGLSLGAERFEHLTRYRRDPLLPRLLGLSRFPSPDTLRRFFTSFTYRRTTDVSEALMRMSLAAMRPILLGHTLDLDSTVFCRYGEQAGSRKGHNPVKPGRPSHHPLVAWLSERRRLLWATLRAGHAGTANGAREFLAQALTMLPPGHRIGLVRADAGFCVTAFLAALEARDLPYIIVARLTRLVRKVVVHRIPEGEWRPVARGIAVADMTASLPAWQGQRRRFVCLRQTLTERPEASGRRLIECPGYTYRLFVTSVPYAAELVTRMYAGRADSENRIKELKEDLSLDTFCLQSFDATDAAFRTGCVLYNLLMGFRETVFPSCWFERRLRAVRDRVFLVGADLVPDARRLRVRFAVPTEERTEFLQRLRALSEGLPMAAQLDWDLSEADEASPPPPNQAHTLVPALPFTPHAAGASP
ncbi:MAG: IS1380 family transposase [Nitrospira sp.]|nr:IS1380 family transposase [Nitrospira sp.]